MKRKRVIFHLGAHKTASTYLQSVFSQQAENLKALGIDYPYAEGDEVIDSGACVGNVVKMLFVNNLLFHSEGSITTSSIVKLWTPACTDFIISAIKNSNYSTLLFSSEGMSKLPQSVFEDLYTKLNEFCDPEFIIFVRDPYDYFYSGWGQIVKAIYYPESFSKFIANTVKQYQLKSEGLFFNIDIFMTEKFKIVNYDTYKKDLLAAFFSMANIDLDMEHSKPIQSVTVAQNRSLSPSEAKLQLLINQQFEGGHFPAFLKASLIDRLHYKPAIKKYYNQGIDKLIMEAFNDKITKINTHIIGDSLRMQCRDAGTTQLDIEPQDVNVLINAFKQVVFQKTIKAPFILQLKHWIMCIRLKHVPLEFDPQAYLFLNKDVAKAKVNPYVHYSQNGYCEGRPYRFF
ncbi:hypothetical protein N9F42_01235 [Pseudomonadales bacterium]|nr:hypothetical protein [Pseudomonadales bacterium]